MRALFRRIFGGRSAEGYPGKGLRRRPEPLRRATVDTAACRRCGSCLERCHYRRIRLPRSGSAVVLTGCSGCGACADACPHGAVRMVSTGNVPEGRPSAG